MADGATSHLCSTLNLIFQNAAATYARSLVALLLGLFSSRWVLQALGAEEFGLYAVVGSLVSLFVFVGGLLNVSVARHYAFAIGADACEDELAQWFSAAWWIHFVLGFFVFVLGFPLGEWAVRSVLVIPPERIETCVAVFRLSLAAACANLLAVPFCAMYTAKQRFVKLAVFGLLQTGGIFVGALWLQHTEGDLLLAYARYMAVAFIGPAIAQILGAMIEFPWCRRLFAWPGIGRVREILGFAGWTLVGGGGWIIAFHGGTFVTNRFFGAAANAAYGVAQQIQYHTEALANALLGAFEPAVTSSEGARNHQGTLRLSYQGGRLGAMLILVFVIPLGLELPTVLRFWLGNPPEAAVSVGRIFLCVAVVNKLIMGQYLALTAMGRIARWQLLCGVSLVVSVPLAVMLALLNGGIVSAALAFLAGIVGCAATSVILAHRLVHMTVSGWLREVVVPVAVTAMVSLGLGTLPRLAVPAGFLRVCITTVLSSAAFVAWGVMWWIRTRRMTADVRKRERGAM